MIQQDISSPNTEMHVCRVERVYNSGLIDARSNRDKFFEQINTISVGAESTYKAGQRCLVITDGSQHYAMGQVREPRLDESGNVTTKNLKNDLADLPDAKALVADDDFGGQAKVVVAPGGGVVLDSGDNALQHMDPGNKKIMQTADRFERITVPCTVEMDHNEVTAKTRYKWRTVTDHLSFDRDLGRDREDALDLAGVLTADIGPSPDVLDIEYKLGPGAITQTKIQINPLGEVTVTGGADQTNKVKIGLDAVSMETTLGVISVNKAGQIKLGNKGGIFLEDLFAQLLTTLSTSTTITVLGPQPLITAPVFQVIKGLLDSINAP